MIHFFLVYIFCVSHSMWEIKMEEVEIDPNFYTPTTLLKHPPYN